jgi:hypothetical protein
MKHRFCTFCSTSYQSPSSSNLMGESQYQQYFQRFVALFYTDPDYTPNGGGVDGGEV